MRISDWSSDVCSSDLHALLVLAEAFAQLHHLRLQRLHLAHRLVGFVGEREEGELDADRQRQNGEAEVAEQESGRASCRERVCQYVSIPVGAVSLKKK